MLGLSQHIAEGNIHMYIHITYIMHTIQAYMHTYAYVPTLTHACMYVHTAHVMRLKQCALLSLSLSGFCCAYLIFIPENLVSIFNTVSPFNQLTK